jgi:hypothetical protein
MKKKIEFLSKNNFVYKSINSFLPSKKYTPQWFVDSPMWIDEEGNPQKIGHTSKKTIKHCFPFLDSLTCGYILETWTEIYVSKSLTNNIQVTWGTNEIPILEFRGSNFSKLLPTPLGCNSDQFTWQMPFGIKTPPGYSVLVTHPFNRGDLPFTTLSGIIDSDKGTHGGNLPVFFSDSFEGIIPIGTPIAQVMPFKRESWNSSVINDEELYKDMEYQVGKFFYGGYKKTKWHKKTFN